MVDIISTQTQAKDLAPLVRQGEASTKVIATQSPCASAPLTADGVNMMYHQLVEIHAITTAQLVECARWHWADSTPCSGQAGTSRPKPGVVPTVTRLAPSPPTDFLSQAPLWPWQGRCNWPHACCQLHPVTTNGGRDKANRAASSEARSRSRMMSSLNTPSTMRQSCSAPHR
jgi:hypothetical protein